MSRELCPVCGRDAHPGGLTPVECAGTPADGVPRAERGPEATPTVPTDVAPTPDVAAPPIARDVRLAPGTLVGEYRIDGLIGEGGTGAVYVAVQPVIGKKVAVKVLSLHLAQDDDAVRRFILEARAVNEIGQRNLVDIFSFGQLTDGRCYYVMEYLDGRTLAQLLRERGRLTPAEAFPIFRDVGLALEAAHGKGIVHRDLKPDNVILVREDDRRTRAKLVDFGLATLTAQEGASGSSSQAALAAGTPHYSSPEQCRGKAVDARSDLYALGVMLFRALCGHLPFDGRTAAEIRLAHIHAPIPRPSARAPQTIGPALDALILRLLAKSPADRVQSARELVDALASLPVGRDTAAARGPEKRRSEPVPTSMDNAPSAGHVMRSPGRFPIQPSQVVSLDGMQRSLTPGVPSALPALTPLGPEPTDDADTRRERRPSVGGRSALLDLARLNLTIMEPVVSTPSPMQVSALDIALGITTPPPHVEAPRPPPLDPTRFHLLTPAVGLELGGPKPPAAPRRRGRLLLVAGLAVALLAAAAAIAAALRTWGG